MPKTHTLIVRGVTKDAKNSLKRIASHSDGRLSVNQVILSMISKFTKDEIAAHKENLLQKKTANQ